MSVHTIMEVVCTALALGGITVLASGEWTYYKEKRRWRK